ncbi:MAG: hypothetical protein KJO34_03010 [Deltaproteobacteria bacterium]|nr:hypothetical protein [Deltaproteobacteria bacterium]
MVGKLPVIMFSIIFLAGPAASEVLAKQSGSSKSQFGSNRQKQKKADKTRKQLELLPLVTAYADNYAARLFQSTLNFQDRLKNNADRLASYYITIQSVRAAYDISVGSNSVIAVLDLTVMVTLQRMAWEQYWFPKRFGIPAKGHLDTLKQLENEIWIIAAEILTPEQRREMRSLVLKWRKTNPNQQIVHAIRFSDFRDDMLKSSKDTRGLFAGVKKAVDAAEELRMLGERYRFLLPRMQMMLNHQLELAYLQMVSRPEVNQLLKNTDRVTSSIEAVAATASKLPETAKNLIKEAGAESEQFRKLVVEVQQMLTVGNELIAGANQTLASIDMLVSRFDPIREKKQGTEPINVAEYRAAAKEFTGTAREANILIQSLDQLLTGVSDQMDATQQSRLLEAFGKLGKNGKELIDYLYYRALIFFLIIIIGITLALLLYRYASIKLAYSSRNKSSL